MSNAKVVLISSTFFSQWNFEIGRTQGQATVHGGTDATIRKPQYCFLAFGITVPAVSKYASFTEPYLFLLTCNSAERLRYVKFRIRVCPSSKYTLIHRSQGERLGQCERSGEESRIRLRRVSGS